MRLTSSSAVHAEEATLSSAVSTIGLVGGTGPAGQGLALRLAAAGYDIRVGSRSETRAMELIGELQDAWPNRPLLLRGVANESAAEADVVVMAAPWSGALSMAPALASRLHGKTVISMANALTRAGSNFLPLTMPRGSVAMELQALLPSSRVVGAFHHLPAAQLADLDHSLDCDVLVFGDDCDARTDVMALVARIGGLRAVDVGTLASAGAVEALTAVLIQVNRRYRTHSMLRVVGDIS